MTVLVGACLTLIVVGGAVYFGTELLRQSAKDKTIAVAGLPVSQDTDPHRTRAREEKSDSSAVVNENLSLPQHSPEAQTLSPPAPGSSPPRAEASPKAEKKEGIEPPRKSQSQRDGQDSQASGPSATKPTAAARRSAAAGTYETTRSTTVFESASSSSQVVANIPGGTRLDVVNTKGEWLEVHSRRGNPPGFIRREDATLIEKTE